MKSLYKYLLHLAKITTSLSFIFGAVVILPYSIYEYFSKKEASRIEQTLSLFKQYNSAPFSNYRETLAAAFAANKDRLIKAAENEDDLRKAILEILKQGTNETSLLFLLGFFDSLTVCVVNKLCDAATSRELFKQNARELFITYYQYIDMQRKTFAPPKFALGLETFAK
jgi:hypothetical protein